jgi:palmitoyltransferase ZDHHC2/15/20
MWEEVFNPGGPGRIGVPDGGQTETMMVHFVILSVISGIIGLVITGFTSYHVYLVSRNRTTLEALEKTRYLSPLKTMVTKRLEQAPNNTARRHSFGDQLREVGTALTEIHADALPGILRPEEGEEDVEMGHDSPAMSSLRRYLNEDNLDEEERQYARYLDDRDNDRLPNAFDLGWRRNITAVLGPSPWLWFLPICNSPGDGWTWEKSETWARKRDEMRWEREREFRNRQENGPGEWVRPQIYPPAQLDGYTAEPEDSSDDDDEDRQRKRLLRSPPDVRGNQRNWNDVPEDMLRR